MIATDATISAPMLKHSTNPSVRNNAAKKSVERKKKDSNGRSAIVSSGRNRPGSNTRDKSNGNSNSNRQTSSANNMNVRSKSLRSRPQMKLNASLSGTLQRQLPTCRYTAAAPADREPAK